VTLRQKVRLELADGTAVETIYDGRDIRAWETKFNRSALAERMSLTQLTYLGWSAAKRDGSINGKFDRYEAFDAECVDVRGLSLDEGEGAPDPSEPDSGTPSDP
jgi:hypothetical protein